MWDLFVKLDMLLLLYPHDIALLQMKEFRDKVIEEHEKSKHKKLNQDC